MGWLIRFVFEGKRGIVGQRPAVRAAGGEKDLVQSSAPAIAIGRRPRGGAPRKALGGDQSHALRSRHRYRGAARTPRAERRGVESRSRGR
jgi:hypothetical protein